MAGIGIAFLVGPQPGEKIYQATYKNVTAGFGPGPRDRRRDRIVDERDYRTGRNHVYRDEF